MSCFTVFLIYVIGAFALSYYRASLRTAAIAGGVLLLIYSMTGGGSRIAVLILVLTFVILTLLSIDAIRRRLVSRPLFSWYKAALPPISETEQEAIDAGTVWWEGELFTGNPDWEKLMATGRVALSEEDQEFLDGPVEELCSMVNTWDINFRQADIPPEILEFIKQQRFLGMIIPKQYGGLELSPVAQSAVLSKLVSIGTVVSNFIMVPNSLGPAELLLKYGTDEQREYYLPRLASGEEIPCFALTAPLAGSDATSIPDTGIVCKGEWEGKEIVGMRLNFNKRYITLAPIATVIGLAFRLRDPDHLIGEVDDYGITCALLPHTTPGLEIGRRHLPIGDPFLNGPVTGKDVFVPLDYIIGGKDKAGMGWRMLVNCLSTGRCISLPSTSNALAKNALAATTVYAKIRRQFNVQIAQFEGVQQPLAEMAGFSYIINAATLQTVKALETGAKPAVPASILKYHCTELARKLLLHAMDIHGGKAVMKGPRNYLASAYESMPVGITVEGANIMTRSLMIFGQGAVRSHPYVLKEMQLVNAGDKDEAVQEFDRVMFEHIGFVYRNGAHAFVNAVTGSRLVSIAVQSPMQRQYRHITRLSTAFALVADMAMLTLQASLKRREMLSARLGDLLSMLYLASMVLKQHEDQSCPREDQPLVEWCCQYLFHRFQEAMHEVLTNFPNRLVALKLRFLIFPLGRRFHMPSDKLSRKVAELVTTDSETRKRLVQGIYATPTENNYIGKLQALLTRVDEMEPLLKKLRREVKDGKLPPLLGLELIEAAEAAGVINTDEAQTLMEYDRDIMDIINVDDFPGDAFIRQP